MRFAAAILAFLPAALATISITAPSETAYWVQNTSNTINWNYESGDPNPISIIVTNSNNSFLNGAFSIHEFVDLTNGTFTVTNVTLRVADGYTVSFVNPTNASQIYANSSTFSVRAPGTPPAASATASSASPSATSPSGNSSASGSGSSSGSSPSATGGSNSNGALGMNVLERGTVFGVIVAGGMAVLGGLAL